MTDPKVELGGKCIIHVNTGPGKSKIEFPKKNPKTGENNADSFINEVFKFSICRHGKEKTLAMLNEKFEKFGDEFNSQGIQ